MAKDRKVIRNGLVIPSAGSEARQADILIEDGVIKKIGRSAMTVPDDAFCINAEGKILIPGLVNAHTHSNYTFGKGLSQTWTLELHQNAGPWIVGKQSIMQLRLGALLGAMEMISKGCTSCYDLVVQLPAPTIEGMSIIGQAYAEIGMRSVVTMMTADRTFWESIPGLLDVVPEPVRSGLEGLATEPYQKTLDGCESVLRDWPFDRSQIKLALGPSIPLFCSDEFFVGAYNLAKEYQVGLHTHLAESKVQAVSALKRYGVSLTEHLDTLGCLEPNLTAAHGVWLDTDDLKRLMDNGVSVAHNPSSNMRLGNGSAPIQEMLSMGLNVGLGTDTSTCSDQLNMFDSMRLSCYASRQNTPDYTRWVTPSQALYMATAGSATSLGFDRIGELKSGYFADIVFLDRNNINYVPLNDARNQIVFCENGAAVESVMINGELVYDGYEFTTINYRRIVDEIESANDALRAQNSDRRIEFEALEDIIGRFCVGLATSPHHLHRYTA